MLAMSCSTHSGLRAAGVAAASLARAHISAHVVTYAVAGHNCHKEADIVCHYRLRRQQLVLSNQFACS
jgi:hypothetical protein